MSEINTNKKISKEQKTKMARNIRLRIEELGLKQKDVAEKLGVDPVCVSYWCAEPTSEKNIQRIPNTLQVMALARLLSCSADYVLGLTTDTTTDADIKAVIEYTGLSEKALTELHEFVTSLYTYFSIPSVEGDADIAKQVVSQIIESGIFQNLVLLSEELKYHSFLLVEAGEQMLSDKYSGLRHTVIEYDLKCDVDRLKINEELTRFTGLFDERARQKEKYNNVMNKSRQIGLQIQEKQFEYERLTKTQRDVVDRIFNKKEGD